MNCIFLEKEGRLFEYDELDATDPNFVEKIDSKTCAALTEFSVSFSLSFHA